MRPTRVGICVIFSMFGLSIMGSAIDVRKELERADQLGHQAAGHLTHNDVHPYWSDHVNYLLYRVNTTRDGYKYFKVQFDTGISSLAFDHAALAAALEKTTTQKINPDKLAIDDLEYSADSSTMRFRAFGKAWLYNPTTSSVSPDTTPPIDCPLLPAHDAMRGTKRNGSATDLMIDNQTRGGIEMFWVDGSGRRTSYGKLAAGKQITLSTFAGHCWLVTDATGQPLAGLIAQDKTSRAVITGAVPSPPSPRSDVSPDGKWRASIHHHNLTLTPTGGGAEITLTNNGEPKNHYDGPILWSPDSKSLVAQKTKEVDTRKVHIVQSSPPDQLQPKLLTIDYPKAGDELRQSMPCLFDIANRKEIAIDSNLFSNPWALTNFAWSADSKEFSFVFNQRGHQVMRIIGINASNGAARTICEERSPTFIDYSTKTWMHRIPSTKEILWASERDGYNHLYLLDEAAGKVKNQITRGSWNVREVVEVDERARRLLIKLNGIKGQDPYHVHVAWVNFDGSGLVRITEGDGTHQIAFSPDHKWLLDTWSRVDQPPVTELRRADNGHLIAELARADDRALLATGWSRPERFVAKARDGTTDIYGIIFKPTHFDPKKSYPVLEDIYAGPHDFFVPKAYAPWMNKNTMAELGFIVVSIDGMGTNWRSKAFHDICWKNLSDAGFPDRMAWIKSAAATRPWMDITRMGIFGGSAGGQSTLAGLLQHGDFYKVGVADCGCHDNRMDKIWWNEAWMGWPVDDSYARNSNVTHAAKLTGKLMLVVGEIDHNVDPASTAQVVAALEKAGKDFEFLPIMNADHGAAETPYGRYRRALFLTRELGATGASK